MTKLENPWIVYFDGKHNYEYENKRFWCRPIFVVKPLFPSDVVKKIFVKLLIPCVPNNKLTVRSNNEVIYTTSVVDVDVDILLDFKEEYVFECLPFYSSDKMDKRMLGAYISYIKVLDKENFLHTISYKDMILFDVRCIKPFIV